MLQLPESLLLYSIYLLPDFIENLFFLAFLGLSLGLKEFVLLLYAA